MSSVQPVSPTSRLSKVILRWMPLTFRSAFLNQHWWATIRLSCLPRTHRWSPIRLHPPFHLPVLACLPEHLWHPSLRVNTHWHTPTTLPLTTILISIHIFDHMRIIHILTIRLVLFPICITPCLSPLIHTRLSWRRFNANESRAKCADFLCSFSSQFECTSWQSRTTNRCKYRVFDWFAIFWIHRFVLWSFSIFYYLLSTAVYRLHNIFRSYWFWINQISTWVRHSFQVHAMFIRYRQCHEFQRHYSQLCYSLETLIVCDYFDWFFLLISVLWTSILFSSAWNLVQ